MSHLRIPSKILLLFIFFPFFLSCEEEPEPGPSLYDSILALPNTSRFIEAIEQVEFDDDLKIDQSLTIFVPTDNAFDRFLSQNNFASIADIPREDLIAIIRYHVLPGGIDLPSLGNAYYLTASGAGPNNSLVAILVENPGTRARLNKNVSVINQDLQAGSGFYNTIDEVLTLPTVLSILRQNDAFEQMANGVFRVDGLADSLQNEELYTFLVAPNSVVETALEDRYDVTDILDLEETTLDSLMKYHVLVGNQTSEILGNSSDFEYETLLSDLDVRIEAVTTISINSNIGLVLSDIQTINGVVHIIDGMLDID
ncbi:MAG: fasciclin domain-containing protein [Bacteroidota bacterium]